VVYPGTTKKRKKEGQDQKREKVIGMPLGTGLNHYLAQEEHNRIWKKSQRYRTALHIWGAEGEPQTQKEGKRQKEIAAKGKQGNKRGGKKGIMAPWLVTGKGKNQKTALRERRKKKT